MSTEHGFRIFLEVCYLLFVIYYTIRELIHIKKQWDRETAKEIVELGLSERHSRCQKFLLYIGIDYKSFRNKNIIIIFFLALLAVLVFLIKQVIKIIKVFLKHLTESLYNLVDFVSVIFSILIIVRWIRMIQIPDLEYNEEGEITNLIGVGGQYAMRHREYVFVTTVNVMITFLRILQFSTFSIKLSTFTEVLGSAAYDLLFFFSMVCIVSLTSIILDFIWICSCCFHPLRRP